MIHRIAKLILISFTLSSAAYAGEICIGDRDSAGACKGISIRY